jgi:hypothetical protein
LKTPLKNFAIFAARGAHLSRAYWTDDVDGRLPTIFQPSGNHNHLIDMSSLLKGRRPFGIQTGARGAGQVWPDTNMDGGPFKLPTKENADAARKKKVRRVPDSSTSRVIERPTNAFPYRQPTAISPRHPTHLTAQEAIATVKKWVESHIPTKHIKDRTCVVDTCDP